MDSNTDQTQKLTRLLEEIRDNQNLQLERQAESMEIQREQFELACAQMEKAKKIQDRAEALQDKSRELMEKGRKVFSVIIPILIGLLVYVSWLIFK